MSAQGNPPDDAVSLVARLADGDDDAIGALYDRFGRLVYALALRITRDATTAEEVTQEAFVRLWRSAASFVAERGSVQTWLMRITHNLALNEIRRRQSRPVVAERFDWEVEGAQLESQDASGDPETVAWERQRASLVRGALDQLPTPQRRAIELAYFGGLSQAEIAAALGEPLGTVKGRMRAGMQRLREVLSAAGLDASAVEAG